MRTTAANVAARAAVGGDDMLSKWQLMAEQARQKREGGVDTSGSQRSKDVSRKPLSTSGRKDIQETEKRGNADSSCCFWFTEVHEEERLSSEKLQKLGWSSRPLKESLIDSVENYCKAGLID
nr:hypothetical protein CFP56_59048 [Quercus suber]